MRPIDGDALKELFVQVLEKIKSNPRMTGQEMHIITAIHTVGQMIDDAPTVETIKRGRWIKMYEDYPISGRCSSCGWNASYTQRDIVGYPYCPYCGAKMEGGRP